MAENVTRSEVYEVAYKRIPDGTWRVGERYDKSTCTVSDLKPNKKYVFKVRIIDTTSNTVFPYGEESEAISTSLVRTRNHSIYNI